MVARSVVLFRTLFLMLVICVFSLFIVASFAGGLLIFFQRTRFLLHWFFLLFSPYSPYHWSLLLSSLFPPFCLLAFIFLTFPVFIFLRLEMRLLIWDISSSSERFSCARNISLSKASFQRIPTSFSSEKLVFGITHFLFLVFYLLNI